MPITSDDIVLSVLGALVGLAFTLPVTYLVVERIIERNERKRLAPVEVTAKERLRSKLGVGFLTTFLITLVIDTTSAVKERKTLPKDTLQLHISKLKSAQSDLEMLIGAYNNVLSVEIEHLTSSIILFIEHLQEDFEYLAQTYPKPLTQTHAAHIEEVILRTVRLTKEELEVLGSDNVQIRALEEWLSEFGKKRAGAFPREEPVEVSGKHWIA